MTFLIAAQRAEALPLGNAALWEKAIIGSRGQASKHDNLFWPPSPTVRRGELEEKQEEKNVNYFLSETTQIVSKMTYLKENLGDIYRKATKAK